MQIWYDKMIFVVPFSRKKLHTFLASFSFTRVVLLFAWSFRFASLSYYWKCTLVEQVSEHVLKDIESMILRIKRSVPIFFTKMDPTYLFEVGTINAKIPLTALHEATVLCVSAIGSAEPFVKQIQKVFLRSSFSLS